jgi:hypothetical protein
MIIINYIIGCGLTLPALGNCQLILFRFRDITPQIIQEYRVGTLSVTTTVAKNILNYL